MTTGGLLEARHPDHRRDFFAIEGLAAAIREGTTQNSDLNSVANM